MNTSIFKNSYIAFIISLIILCVLFYFFEIGWTTQLDQYGKVIKKFSWKYPLAISLIVWIVWHFYLYPPPEELINPASDYQSKQNPAQIGGFSKESIVLSQINSQHIDMNNWI